METNNEHKAAVSGAIQTLGPALATSFNAVMDILGVGIPQTIPILFAAAYGLFGYYLCFQQEKINAFAEWIRTHPNEFAEHIVTQPSFQEGFISTIETYMRVRSEQKRELIKQVFLGFAESVNKEDFELERFYETIKIISIEQIKALSSFEKRKSIQLTEEREDLLDTYIHTNYEALRSLEGLGLTLLSTDISVDLHETYSGDEESGLTPDGVQRATSKKREYMKLTDFGEGFIFYLQEVD